MQLIKQMHRKKVLNQKGSNPATSHIQTGSNPATSHIQTVSNPATYHIQAVSNPATSHIFNREFERVTITCKSNASFFGLACIIIPELYHRIVLKRKVGLVTKIKITMSIFSAMHSCLCCTIQKVFFALTGSFSSSFEIMMLQNVQKRFLIQFSVIRFNMVLVRAERRLQPIAGPIGRRTSLVEGCLLWQSVKMYIR